MSRSVRFLPGEFIADSVTLSAEQTGAFIILLAAYWHTGTGIEDDDKIIARMIRVGPARWRKHIRPGLARFFDLSAGAWTPIDRHLEPPDTGRLSSAAWAVLRQQIFERDNFTCVYCGVRPDRPECDHRLPVSRGGTNDPGNLATACHGCNRAKGALTPEEWRARV